MAAPYNVNKREKESKSAIFSPSINDVHIYILPRKLQKRRIELLKSAAIKQSFNVTNSFGNSVTHVVCEESISAEEACSAVSKPDIINPNVELLSIKWLSDSLKEGQLIWPIFEYRLKQQSQTNVTEKLSEDEEKIQEYICMRRNPLNHFNEKFTKALELLEENARLHEDDTRALAFRRCSATLRSLSYPVTDLRQVQGLPDVGNHCLRVIKDMLENGISTEADDIEHSNDFLQLKAFNGVFGIGPSTARKWIAQGISSVDEANRRDDIRRTEDKRMSVGLAFHKDLALRVTKNEAYKVTEMIRMHAQEVLPGTIAKLSGGFSRGKQDGHDIDILLTHPEQGREQGLLYQLLSRLDSCGLIVSGKQEKSTYQESVLKSDKGQALRSSLDHFEKWLGVIRVENVWRDSPETIPPETDKESISKGCYDTDTLESLPQKPPLKHQLSLEAYHKMAAENRNWRARRLDLIIVPYNQWAYAVVGWTGSRQFNRSLRLYAQKKMNMKLTSHGIYDYTTGKSVPAKTEADVFTILQIPHRQPEDRNA